MSLVHQLIGDTTKGNDRRKDDFYPTPNYVINALLDNEVFDGFVWEPCCGDGAISKQLEARNYVIKSTDLNDYGYGKTGVDFLKEREPYDNIITNPPFGKIGTQITLHALHLARKKVAIFHKIAFLEGNERYNKIFKLKKLETIYPFVKRVGFNNDGRSGMMAFAWFVWNKEFEGDPKVKWLNV